MAPACRLCELQVRDIGTGDEQDESDRREQDQEGLAHAAV